MENTKLVYCYYGAGLAVGIYGTRQEVERQANLLYNFNATDSRPIWQTENTTESFAYILTNWDKLKRGYTDMFVAGKLRQTGKTPNFHTLKPWAETKAAERISTIEAEDFLEKDGNGVHIYSLGNHSNDSFTSED